MTLTVDERLASIDTTLALLDQRLEAHTAADENNFSQLSNQLKSIEDKVDDLRITDAVRKAIEINGTKRASIFGGGVAAAIVAFVEGIKYFAL